MFVKIVSGVLREVWAETVPQDGGASQTISTGIPCSTASLSKIDAKLILTTVTGTPIFGATLGILDGHLTVTLANTAGAGNLATWTLDVRLNHSIQQARGAAGALPAPVSILLGGNAISGTPLLGQVAEVATSGAQYTSVAAAIAAVTPFATVNTPWVVSVASGVYFEPPFTIPPYVTVQGLGFAVLAPTNNGVDFISGTPTAFLNYVTVFCPSGFGTAGVRLNTAGVGDFLIANLLLIGTGRYGLRVSQGIAQVSNLLQAGGSFDQFVRADGGECILTNASYRTSVPASTIHGFACTGVGSVLRISNSLFENAGSIGAFVDNGGLLTFQGMQFVEGSTAIHVGNTGAPVMLARSTTIQEPGFTTTLKVDTAAATVHFAGAMARNKFLFVPGVRLQANFADVTSGDGGSTTIGDTYVGLSANPNAVLPQSAYARDTYLTGHISGGEVTRAGGRVLNVAAGLGYINDDVQPLQINWLAGSITLAANSTEYIWVDLAGALHHTVSQPDYATSIVLDQAMSNATDIVFLTIDNIHISHVASRLQEFLEDNIGPLSVGGIGTTAPGLLKINTDAGTFAVGLLEHDATPQTPATFVYWYQSAPGVWVSVPGATDIDAARYNDPALGLVAIPGGSYKKDCVFVATSDDGTEVHVVYGQEVFVSQVAAEQGPLPTAPGPITRYAMRSGGVVVLSGAAAIASVVDARPRIGQSVTLSGAVTDHGALTGLADDDHLLYLTVSRANTWHLSTPVVGEAHVKNGNLHVHGIGGDGGQIDHVTLANIGTNTHAQIDTHIDDTANPHATTFTQVGAPPATLTLTAGAGLTGGGTLAANRTFDIGANADGSITVNANDIQVGVLATDAQHGARGGGTQHAVAVAGVSNGFISAADQTKLDGLPTSAVPTARTITAGNGLTGGGDLSANRTLTVLAADTTITVAVGGISVGTITDTNVAAANKDGLAAVASMRTLGTGATQACGGTDARLSDTRLPRNYQSVVDATRTTLTGVGSTTYGGLAAGTKLTLTTGALVAGTYKVSWSAVLDYNVINQNVFIRIQNTTDVVTLAEEIWRPSNAAQRQPFTGYALVTFTGAAKAFAMQFHNTNQSDASGVAFAYLDIERVA
jgi:hypothetical protein